MRTCPKNALAYALSVVSFAALISVFLMILNGIKVEAVEADPNADPGKECGDNDFKDWDGFSTSPETNLKGNTKEKWTACIKEKCGKPISAVSTKDGAGACYNGAGNNCNKYCDNTGSIAPKVDIKCCSSVNEEGKGSNKFDTEAKPPPGTTPPATTPPPPGPPTTPPGLEQKPPPGAGQDGGGNPPPGGGSGQPEGGQDKEGGQGKGEGAGGGMPQLPQPPQGGGGGSDSPQSGAQADPCAKDDIGGGSGAARENCPTKAFSGLTNFAQNVAAGAGEAVKKVKQVIAYINPLSSAQVSSPQLPAAQGGTTVKVETYNSPVSGFFPAETSGLSTQLGQEGLVKKILGGVYDAASNLWPF